MWQPTLPHYGEGNRRRTRSGRDATSTGVMERARGERGLSNVEGILPDAVKDCNGPGESHNPASDSEEPGEAESTAEASESRWREEALLVDMFSTE